jgi:carbonic anhydrase
MAAIVNDDTQSIVVGSGNDRVAINLRQTPADQTQSLLLTSIVIEMGDIEIQIRRSTKAIESLPTSTKSSVLAYQNGNQEKKSTADEKPTYWDYSISHGPHTWGRIFPQIQNKKFQSPIRIYTDQCEYEPELARHPFIFHSDENCCQTLENIGHSFQVTGKGYSHISGGPVPDEYQFLQFHMHWGLNDLEGAEHVVDGVRLPGELHIVTWNTSRYQTPQAAAASDQFDGLMVFGILIKIVPSDNEEVGKLLDLFSKITYKGEKVNLDYGTVSLKDLLPKDLQSYYTYNGSLTTPMCYESVRWIVFREKMGLSRRQFDQLRQLKCICKGDNGTNGNINQNFRPVMPLNGRVVYRSFN